MTPLTVDEARAILAVDETLTDFLTTDASSANRPQLEATFGTKVLATWEHLVASARDRVVGWERK